MLKVKTVSERFCNKIIDGARTESKTAYEPRGLFVAKSRNGRFIAIDNSIGEAWTEDFETREDAEAWLRGEFEIDAWDRTDRFTPPPAQVVVFVYRKLFEFESIADWVNNAPKRYDPYRSILHALLAVDAVGRVCSSGFEFERARDDQPFPVSVYLTTDRYSDQLEKK